MREEVEKRAERVLARVPAWMWDGRTLPVPVEDIADSCFGLHVREADDLTTAPGVPETEGTLSGLLLPSRGEIWVNAHEAREWPPRRRFTIGHELGHWCLHRERGDPAVYCRTSAVEVPDEESRAAFAPEEEDANFFAAALLMPARLVRRHYERLLGSDPRDRFAELCSLFEASNAAMGRRLHAVVPRSP
jgi:IrrE N-terminal-like domain